MVGKCASWLLARHTIPGQPEGDPGGNGRDPRALPSASVGRRRPTPTTGERADRFLQGLRDPEAARGHSYGPDRSLPPLMSPP
jgi:hypothetical protein